MKQILKYLIFIMIGIILYSYINSYNTFSIGIPSEYYNYVLDVLKLRKNKLEDEKARYMVLNLITLNQYDNRITNLQDTIDRIDMLITELTNNPEGIDEDRLIQIDNAEFFNLFFRPCAAAHLRV